MVGCLKGVFYFQGFDGVNVDMYSLIELDSWVCLGMIFVVLDFKFKGKFDIDEWF